MKYSILLCIIVIIVSTQAIAYGFQDEIIYDKSKVFVRLTEATNSNIAELEMFGEIIDSKSEVFNSNSKGSKNDFSVNWFVLKGDSIDIDDILLLEQVTYANYFIKSNSDKSIGVTGLVYAKPSTNNYRKSIKFLKL